MGNPFNWVELTTHDVEGAKAFYGRLFDWKLNEMATPMGPYVLAETGEKPGAGMMGLPEPGVPTTWTVYVHVDDIRAYAAKVEELGGKVEKGPFEVPDVGWIAIVSDPQGAYFGLYQPQ
ncbi:MAG: VOC family protein [Pseudomonadota bacterium]